MMLIAAGFLFLGIGVPILMWIFATSIARDFEAIDQERDRLEMESLRGDY